MSVSNLNFSEQELLRLALAASSSNNSGAAIAYLRDAVANPNATGMVHYLLGAEYAQAQMYDRAIFQMETAISLDASLTIARFQLGLLLLTSGDGSRAEEILSPLQELQSDNAFHHFGKGLIHLIHDQFSECAQCLLKGIEMNVENAPLNTDMQKILAEIEKLSPGVTTADENENDQESGQHVLLSAYTGKNEH